jgi:hypothetical protein
MRVKTLLVIAVAALLLSWAPMTFAQNLITNGSFETSDFTGWTTGGNFEDTEVVSGAFYDYTGAEDGNFYAVLGPVGSDGTLSQTFSDTAGQQYNISFWIASVGDNPSDFSVTWDGTTLVSLSNPNTGANWSELTFSATGTGSDTLTFSFRDDPAYIGLDNISVTAQSGTSVPEPSSILLMGSGVLAMAGVIRRKLGR